MVMVDQETTTAASVVGEPAAADLDRQIAALTTICADLPLATADPLGIGGLLTAAHTLAQLTQAGLSGYGDLLVSRGNKNRRIPTATEWPPRERAGQTAGHACRR
jgi:hypothetical protein